MTPLRQRMLDAMTVRGLAERTQECYSGAIARMALHYRRSPELLSAAEIETYLLHLVKDQGIGAITQVTSAAALIARLKAQYEQARRRLGLASTRLTRGRIRFARQCSVFPPGASSWS